MSTTIMRMTLRNGVYQKMLRDSWCSSHRYNVPPPDAKFTNVGEYVVALTLGREPTHYTAEQRWERLARIAEMATVSATFVDALHEDNNDLSAVIHPLCAACDIVRLGMLWHVEGGDALVDVCNNGWLVVGTLEHSPAWWRREQCLRGRVA